MTIAAWDDGRRAFVEPALALDLIEWHCEVGNIAPRRVPRRRAS